MYKIILIFLFLLLLVNILFLEFIFSPEIFIFYDDEGFYGGSIILLFLYIALPSILCFSIAIAGSIAYFFVPFIFQEFMSLIKMYDNLEFKKALTRNFIHLLFFLPIVAICIYFAFILEASIFYIFALLVFLGSCFVGFYIFLYFLFSLYTKNLKKVFISLILGASIFIFFAPSAYFIFSPIYKTLNDK